MKQRKHTLTKSSNTSPFTSEQVEHIIHPRSIITFRSRTDIIPLSIPAYSIKTDFDQNILFSYHHSNSTLQTQSYNGYTFDDITFNNTPTETSSVFSAESASTCTLASSVSAFSMFSLLSDLSFNANTNHLKINIEPPTISADIIENQTLLTETFETVLVPDSFVLKQNMLLKSRTHTYDSSKFVLLTLCAEPSSVFKYLLPHQYSEFLFYEPSWKAPVFNNESIITRPIYTSSLSQLMYSGIVLIQDLSVQPTEELYYDSRSKKLLKINSGKINDEYIRRLYTQNAVPDETYINLFKTHEPYYTVPRVQHVHHFTDILNRPSNTTNSNIICSEVKSLYNLYDEMYDETDIRSNNTRTHTPTTHTNRSYTDALYTIPSQRRAIKTTLGYYSHIVNITPTTINYSPTPTIRTETQYIKLFGKLYEQYIRNSKQHMISLKILYQICMNIVNSGKRIILVIDAVRPKELYTRYLIELLCNKLDFSNCSWNK